MVSDTSVDIDSIKRKVLIKYPDFSNIIENLEFKVSYDIEEIDTAETDGKILFYNPKFLNKLSDKEKTFLFAHELCHIALDHIYRREGKNKLVWNTATDAVINALLQADGLQMIKGGIDIPEAINYDAEEMYYILMEERERKKQAEKDKPKPQYSYDEQGKKLWQDDEEEQDPNYKEPQKQNNENKEDTKSNEEKQDSQDSEEQQSSKDNESQQNSQNNEEQQEFNSHHSHSLWDKAIEERKKEQQKQPNEFAKKGEHEFFKQNKIERRRRLQELNKELARQSAYGTENEHEHQTQGKKLSDIGIATRLIDWRRLLRQAVKYDEEWTRKNARMRNGYFRHRIEEVPIPETEILLDTSKSVSETLLKNFLKECKNILATSKVKVGCFNTKFHGFTELKRVEDIDNMTFPIGGGTNFNVAVDAFSARVPNKIIFTDGEAKMPEKVVRNVTWVVFGEQQIAPKGRKSN